MALELTGLAANFLYFLIAQHCIIVAACNEDLYAHFIEEFCLAKFRIDMDDLGRSLWCDWDATIDSYKDVINCTYLVSRKLDCFWPNQAVDSFFTSIHRHYFKNCTLAGRLPQDPPYHILCSLIAIPILVTLLMTGLVVWRSKRNEGIV